MSADAMSALAPDAIRARRRPAAVLLLYFAELAWALLVAVPVHAWARHVWGAHPEGDAVLFAGGNRELLVWLGQADAALPTTARTTMVLLVLGTVLLQLPLGALLASLAFERNAGEAGDAGVMSGAAETGVMSGAAETGAARRSLRTVDALRVSVSAFLALAGALVLGAVAAIVVLGLGGLAASAVDGVLTERLGDARAFTAGVLVFALFAAIAAIVGVFVDLARAAIARSAGLLALRGPSSTSWSMLLHGVGVALSTARRSLGRATLAWASRAAAGAALLAIGYAITESLGGKGGAPLVALFVAHQAIVLGRTALRASWLARALTLVAPVQDARNSPPLGDP
jgi:hypothetical protein